MSSSWVKCVKNLPLDEAYACTSTERMACYWSGSSPGAAEADEYASSSMLDAAAGAVAARGVLFANVHQASLRSARISQPTQAWPSICAEDVLTQRGRATPQPRLVDVHDGLAHEAPVLTAAT